MSTDEKWEALRRWLKSQDEQIDPADEDAWGKSVMLERIEDEMERLDASKERE